MGDTRMHRQFGHGLTVSGQLPASMGIAAERAEALEQILRLRISGGGRRVEPGQISGLRAPARQLQRHAGEVRLEYFGVTVGGQLRMLIFGP